MATRVTTKTALTRQIHFVKWHWRIWNLILLLYCLVADAADIHMQWQTGSIVLSRVFPPFFWIRILRFQRVTGKKEVHESAASFVLFIPDCCSRYLPGVAVWRSGFLFLFHFLCSKLSYWGLFFYSLNLLFGIFFLTTVTSPTWKSWWKVLPIT